MVTPVPKIHPPEKLEDLRKISGLINCSKVADKLIGYLVIKEMKPTIMVMRKKYEESTTLLKCQIEF